MCKHVAFVFYKFHIRFFSYLCSKKKQTNTLHILYVWRKKYVKAQREDHVATRFPGCKNLTHTNKTRQVKRTQMVATARFTICAFVAFSHC